MQSKYKRLFLIETQYRRHMQLAAILIAVICVLNVFVGMRGQALGAVKKEKELVSSVPIMEKLISTRTQQAPVRPKDVDAPAGPINLEGTYVKKGITYALINGSILSVGDTYGDYEIMKIEFGTAVLRNQKTNEQQILQFFYYE